MSPQARKGSPARRAPQARARPGTRRTPTSRKRLVALVLAVALIAATVIVVAARGSVGEGSPPEEGVAEVQDVEGGIVTQEDFDQAIRRVAEQQGLNKPPEPGDQQYEAIRDQALGDVLLPLWISGEAADRGITVTDQEIDQRTQQVIDQNFGSQKEFERFVSEQGFCTEDELAEGDPANCEGVREEVEVMILAEELQEAVVPPALTQVTSGEATPEEAAQAIPQEEVEDFYEENESQYEVPETRDVRVIQNQDRSKVEQAIAELEQDDSEKSWDAVAKKYSQDPVSKDRGGLLEGVVEGQSPGGPAFDEAVFGASEGEIVGPIETDNGFYAAQVVNLAPASTTPLSEVEDQIRQQLATDEQTELVTQFEEDFITKWTERTVCDPAIANDRCVNFEPPNPRSCDGVPPDPEGCPQQADPLACNEELAQSQGCAAPAISRRPRAPGGPADSDPLTNLAQGPFPPAQPQQQPGAIPGLEGIPGGAPGGAVPPTGAPPGGAVPPTGAPPGAAPPGAAPPGAAPPTGAPPGGAPPGGAPPGGAPVPTP